MIKCESTEINIVFDQLKNDNKFKSDFFVWIEELNWETKKFNY